MFYAVFIETVLFVFHNRLDHASYVLLALCNGFQKPVLIRDLKWLGSQTLMLLFLVEGNELGKLGKQ